MMNQLLVSLTLLGSLGLPIRLSITNGTPVGGGATICFIISTIDSVGSCKLSGPPDDARTEGVCVVDMVNGQHLPVTWTTLKLIHTPEHPGTLAMQVDCPKHEPDKDPT